jgi:hypothetical protein
MDLRNECVFHSFIFRVLDPGKIMYGLWPLSWADDGERAPYSLSTELVSDSTLLVEVSYASIGGAVDSNGHDRGYCDMDNGVGVYFGDWDDEEESNKGARAEETYITEGTREVTSIYGVLLRVGAGISFDTPQYLTLTHCDPSPIKGRKLVWCIYLLYCIPQPQWSDSISGT